MLHWWYSVVRSAEIDSTEKLVRQTTDNRNDADWSNSLYRCANTLHQTGKLCCQRVRLPIRVKSNYIRSREIRSYLPSPRWTLLCCRPPSYWEQVALCQLEKGRKAVKFLTQTFTVHQCLWRQVITCVPSLNCHVFSQTSFVLYMYVCAWCRLWGSDESFYIVTSTNEKTIEHRTSRFALLIFHFPTCVILDC